MKFSCKLRLKKDRTTSDGKNPIYLQVYTNGDLVRISTNVFVRPEDWNFQREEVKTVKDSSTDTNLILRDMVARANKIAVDYRLMGKPLTGTLFRKEFDDPSNRIDFLKFYKKELWNRRGMIEISTWNQNLVTLKRLQEFSPHLTFSDLTLDFLESFEKHLKSKYKIGGSTLSHYMKNIKTYVNIAIKKGIQVNNPFIHYKVKRVQGNRDYLNKEELKKLIKIYNDKSTNPAIRNVLQYFIFSCFTGLRLSDIKQVTKANIIGDELVFMPQKTKKKNQKVRVPLSLAAKQFISEDPRKLFDHIISDQKINTFLKKIQSAAGIRKKITFHVSRHTFATNFLSLGGDVIVLKELLDHENIQTTMIYSHMAEEETRKREQIKVFDEEFIN